MLLYPNESLLGTTYTLEFKTRLVYSFLTVTLLFGFYEYSRQKSYNHIQELSQQHQQLAMHDPLTKLLNRRGMRTHLEHEYSRLQRSKEPLSVLLCDIDYFKQVNDSYFHDGGDFVLAEKIRKQVENQTMHYKNNTIKVTLSIGVNEVKPDLSVDQAINDADHLLYLAKNRGRNQTVASDMLLKENG